MCDKSTLEHNGGKSEAFDESPERLSVITANTSLEVDMKRDKGEHAASMRTAVQVITMVVALAALIFTGIQTRISSRAVAAQTLQNLTQEVIEISKIMVEYPELRPYFYEGEPITRDDPNYSRVMAVAEMYLDFLESFQDDYVRSLNGMGEGGEVWDYWENYFKDMFATSPTICLLSIETQHWYSTDFTKYRNKDCKAKRNITPSNAVRPDQ